MPLENINHILLILSGKGGVGKSSITTQLALTLSLRGHAVGVLDVDLTGPSIPRFFGLENAKVTQAPGGLVPVNVHQERKADGGISFGRLDVLSLGFILSTRNTAVIWRGPKKTAMVRQFLTSTLWPPLDYLLIDTPPGTSDEHISLLETLLRETSLDPPHTSNGAGTGSSSKPHLAGAILVTTPQAISTSDVRKELSFCRQTSTPMLGIIENMSGYVCPHCAECTYIFSRGGGEAMAQEFEVPYLGALPLDAAWGELIETGKRPEYPDGTKEAVGARSQERQDGEGTSGSEAANARNGEADRSAEGRDPAEKDEKGECLVEKYTDCSLYPLMKAIVEKALGTSSTQSTNGSSSTAVAR